LDTLSWILARILHGLIGALLGAVIGWGVMWYLTEVHWGLIGIIALVCGLAAAIAGGRVLRVLVDIIRWDHYW